MTDGKRMLPRCTQCVLHTSEPKRPSVATFWWELSRLLMRLFPMLGLLTGGSNTHNNRSLVRGRPSSEPGMTRGCSLISLITRDWRSRGDPHYCDTQHHGDWAFQYLSHWAPIAFIKVSLIIQMSPRGWLPGIILGDWDSESWYETLSNETL